MERRFFFTVTIYKMTEVLHANVFFFITSIGVIIFSLLLCIVLFHIIKILKSIRMIIERIETGSEIIAEDMTSFRESFTRGGILSHLIGIFMGLKSSIKPTKKKRKSKTKLVIKDED